MSPLPPKLMAILLLENWRLLRRRSAARSMLEIPPPRCHMRQRCDAPMTRSMREDVALQRRAAVRDDDEEARSMAAARRST
jgi:hypothetical protein